ncbi:MAG: hypothetical protein RDV48_17260 [Candidatus Eremiobacteraeota bacterium]|nr:hypothetical protein [Candidatus Eremiobacteraeota bacterium]
MTASPFEVAVCTAAALVFFIVMCLILASVKKLKIVAFMLILLALVVEYFTVIFLFNTEQCVNNERVLRIALVKYHEEKDAFPPRLESLVPRYIKAIPTCSVSGKNGYSPSYKVLEKGKECTFCCPGDTHAYRISLGKTKSIVLYEKKDFPSFDSRRDYKDRVK